MVRSIQSCSACGVRFVFHGTGKKENNVCFDCSRKTVPLSKQNANDKENDNDEINDNDNDNDCGVNDGDGIPQTDGLDLRDESDSCASEGGDDFHCTPIMDEDDDTKTTTEVRRQQQSKRTTLVHSCLHQPKTEAIPADICFICGADLSRLKRRIDHIKRCSKKHGITGKDVRQADKDSISSTATTEIAPNHDEGWHADAEQLLKLEEHETLKDAPTVDSTRNLNNVLMAGSRRLEIADRATKGVFNNNNNGTNNTKKRFQNWNCPVYKRITGTDFCVDGFHYAKASLTKNYFLTHFHSDHYGGICSSWDVGTIYCSLVTASLVSQQLGVDKKYIHPLPMNTPTLIVSKNKTVTVTLIDANHCPGAVMFLFQVGRRNILHVGDFRWSREQMLREAALQPIVSQTVGLDELYLDTTYCHEKYQLPPQSKTIRAIIEAFGNELTNGKRTLHLFGAYTIGKEKMFLSVAEHYGKQVYVDKRRYKILSVLNLREHHKKLLTTNKEDADVWVVPMGHLNMKKLPEYFAICNSKPFCKPYEKIVGYRPTGWSLSRTGIISCRNSKNMSIYSVPYSEHSSFPELVDCLECLKPAKIVVTVGASKREEQIKRLLDRLRNRQNALKMFPKKI